MKRFSRKSIFNNISLNIDKLRGEMSKVGMGIDPPTEEMTLASENIIMPTDEMNSMEKSLNFNFNMINSVIKKETLILVTNIKDVIIYVNDECSTSLGYRPEELIGKQTRIFKTGMHSKKFYRDLRKTLLSGRVWKGEMTSKRKDDTTKWYYMSMYPLFDDNNKLCQFLTIRTDITDLKEMEKQVLLKEKQLHSFFGILTHVVAGCMDQNGEIIYLSPSVEDILGYNAEEHGDLSVFDFIDPQALPAFKKAIKDLERAPGRSISIEVMLKSKSGAIRAGEFSAKNCLHDPILKGIVFICRDITEQKKLNRKMENLANYDSLTGLPNHTYFAELLNREIDSAKESNMNLAIVQLGLDGFKYVNSAFGHSAGNQLLRDFSSRMKSALKENIFMHKMSGDIFTILITNIVEYDDIYKILDELMVLITNEPFIIGENEVHITGSMGVSVFPYSGEERDILLKNAEIAMFHAKDGGKNQYQIFSSTMSLSSYKQFVLRNDSKKALFRNEFDVYYQPRINPITNELQSAEALIRWNHPKWGLVLPEEFISMAEDSGLIIPVGEWMIRKICSKLKKWEDENLPIKKISINLSSLQLLQPNFVEMVSSILKEFSVNPKWIEFEITETVIIEKEEQVLETLTALKNLGITIALDDFGTGYSSLNYLRKYPCEIIKIDKSLIKDIHKDKDNFEIIASIISLCHKLKKSVVAEGVETEEQLSLLRKLNCNEIQGYIYSKPIDIIEYKRILREGIMPKVEKAATIPKVNRRGFFRVQLKIPLLADMTIEEFENKKINIGSTEVFIKNIGPGGICFYSPLKLPASKDIILLFKTEILSIEWRLKGNIMWQKEMEDNFNEYGVKFILNEGDQKELTKVLNTFQVMLKQKSILPGCRFDTN